MKHSTRRCLRIGITVFILFLVMYYWSTLENAVLTLLYATMPLLGGFITAYIVNIPMSFFERILFGKVKNKKVLRIKRPLCMLLSFAAVTAIVFLISKLIVPELVSCVKLLGKELPPILENWYEELETRFGLASLIEENLKNQFGENTDWKDLVERAVNLVMNGLGGVMDSVFTVILSVFSTIFSIFISFVFAVYLLSGKEKLSTGIDKVLDTYLPCRIKHALEHFTSVINDCFHRFIVGQCTEAVVLGVLCILGMMIFRFPYASMIGTLIGFTALIPVAGAYIGAAVGAFMVFTADSFLSAVLFIIFIIVLQQLEGNLIYPKVVGASIGLPSIWVLAVITVGGAVAGIVGMLLGVPLAATVYKLLKDDMQVKNACVPQMSPGKTDK